MNTTLQRAIVLSLLVLLMAATRSHVFSHFTPVPDASWAVFLIGGLATAGNAAHQATVFVAGKHLVAVAVEGFEEGQHAGLQRDAGAGDEFLSMHDAGYLLATEPAGEAAGGEAGK